MAKNYDPPPPPQGVQGLILYLFIVHSLHHNHVVQGAQSEEQDLDCNVPQGSVLGPGLFGDYGYRVGHLFRKHLYTDDTRMYVTSPEDEEDVFSGARIVSSRSKVVDGTELFEF